MTITAHSPGSEPGARALDSDAQAKRLRRLERSLDSRPLDAWERYRGFA